MRKRTIVLLAVLLVFGIGVTVFRVFFVRGVRVPTAAMANTIMPGDTLLMIKSLGQIERGEIVMFQYSGEYAPDRDRYHDDGIYYVKRVVGLPGETIQIRGRTVFINGQPLQEQKVIARDTDPDEPMQEISTEGSGPYRVFYSQRPREDESALISEVPFAVDESFQTPKDSYFLLGDNRDNSEDSRYRGPVPRKLIWGKAAMIFYSETMKTREFRWDRLFKKVH